MSSKTGGLIESFKWIASEVMHTLNVIILGRKSSIAGAIMRIFILVLALLLSITSLQFYSSRLASNALKELGLTQIMALTQSSAINSTLSKITISTLHLTRDFATLNEKEIAEEKKVINEGAESIKETADQLVSTFQAAKLEYKTDEFDNVIEQSKKLPEAAVALRESAESIPKAALKGDLGRTSEILRNLENNREKIEKTVGAFSDELQICAASRAGASNQKVNNVTQKGLILSAITVGLTVLFILLLNHFVLTRMRESDERIRSGAQRMTENINEVVISLDSTTGTLKGASAQLSDNTGQLADGTSKQASAIEESIAAIEEISSMVSQTAKQAAECAQLASETNDQVSMGRETVQRMDAGMQAIRDANAKIQDIVTIVSQISKKTKVINNIVTKTELLSFNASIEAARAGEHGRGFAVVAEEVGNLARLSGQSAEEIRQLIDQGLEQVKQVADEINQRVDTGTSLSTECVSAFGEIQKRAEILSNMVIAIRTAAHEQERGLTQTKLANQNIEQATQTNQSIASKTARLSQEVADVAGELVQMMGQLNEMIAANQKWVQDSRQSQTPQASKPRDPEADSNSVAEPAQVQTSGQTSGRTSGLKIAPPHVQQNDVQQDSGDGNLDQATILSLYKQSKHSKQAPGRNDPRFGTSRT